MVGVALEDKDGLNIGGGRHVDVVADDAGKTVPVSNAGGSRPVRTVEMRTARRHRLLDAAEEMHDMPRSDYARGGRGAASPVKGGAPFSLEMGV
ncbi:hypothetical protein D1007_03386 [Hordeum vulgare]|nr:hypothetical protein D1007_03386 [Hordeum vulgare]